MSLVKGPGLGLSAVLKDGAREGGESPAAAAAAPPRDAGLVEAALLVDGFSEQQELIGD